MYQLQNPYKYQKTISDGDLKVTFCWMGVLLKNFKGVKLTVQNKDKKIKKLDKRNLSDVDMTLKICLND